MAPNIFWSVLRQDDDVAFIPDIEPSKFHNPGDSENTRIPRIVRYQKILNVQKDVEGTSGKIAEVQVMFFSKFASTSLSLYQIYTIYKPSMIKK